MTGYKSIADMLYSPRDPENFEGLKAMISELGLEGNLIDLVSAHPLSVPPGVEIRDGQQLPKGCLLAQNAEGRYGIVLGKDLTGRPLPPEVAEALRNGQQLENQIILGDPERGFVFVDGRRLARTLENFEGMHRDLRQFGKERRLSSLIREMWKYHEILPRVANEERKSPTLAYLIELYGNLGCPESLRRQLERYEMYTELPPSGAGLDHESALQLIAKESGCSPEDVEGLLEAFDNDPAVHSLGLGNRLAGSRQYRVLPQIYRPASMALAERQESISRLDQKSALAAYIAFGAGEEAGRKLISELGSLGDDFYGRLERIVTEYSEMARPDIDKYRNGICEICNALR